MPGCLCAPGCVIIFQQVIRFVRFRLDLAIRATFFGFSLNNSTGRFAKNFDLEVLNGLPFHTRDLPLFFFFFF